MRPFSNQSRVVYARTYSRKDSGYHENYPDSVERVILGNVKNFSVTSHEIERLRYYFLERKAMVAGRGMWFSGSPSHAKLGGVGLVNCWALTADDWMSFVISADLLMLGGGVGMSVESRFVDKLPKIKTGVKVVHKETKDADFIVPDSREGWCKLIMRTLEAYFVTGKSFTYSTVCIRGAGEPIKGFGGTASGPIPLIKMVEKLGVLLTSREGRYVRPIDAADIICIIAEMVVAGNVRRSAIMIMCDAHDRELLKAKRWDLGVVPSHRAMANFSVIADDAENDLRPLFWATYEHGEPFGIINRANIQKYGRMGELNQDTGYLVNPCLVETSTVLTPGGIIQFKDLKIGDTIWSGKKWTKVVNKWSNGTKQVKAYKTRVGTFYGTPNHHVFQNGERVEVQDAEGIDFCVGERVSFKEHLRQAVVDGLMIGDGYYEGKLGKNALVVGENDQDYFDSEIAGFIIGKMPAGYMHGQGCFVQHSIEGPLPKTYERTVPGEYFYSDAMTKASFLRGLYSANGSVVGNGGSARVTLKSSSFALVEQVQQMLSSLGIRSYHTVNKSHAVKFSNGTYTCKESYDINVTSDKHLFLKAIGFLQNYKTAKLVDAVARTERVGVVKKTAYDIVETTDLRDQEVFDITVDAEEHSFWCNGLLVSNCGEATLEPGGACNLQDINLAALESVEEFIEAAQLMHRYGKRVTCERYHHKLSQDAIAKSRRVGTGITGCLEAPQFFNPEVLDRVYAAIQAENDKYSFELNIPRSIRTTTVKPSGTLSKLMGTSAEGIHPAYSRHYIQRIRFSGTDPLVPALRRAGHNVQPAERIDGSIDPSTVVVDFYVEAPAHVPTADGGFDTWKQLDVVKMAQRHWSDQSVSVTVYYKKDEIEKVKDWVKHNLNEIKTISFLPHSDHGFIQAPKEPITAAQYEKLSAKIRPLDEVDFGDGDIDSQECGSGSCPIK